MELENLKSEKLLFSWYWYEKENRSKLYAMRKERYKKSI
jgi:hypothetical protein